MGDQRGKWLLLADLDRRRRCSSTRFASSRTLEADRGFGDGLPLFVPPADTGNKSPRRWWRVTWRRALAGRISGAPILTR
jgi:hypothetical protein